MRVTCTGCGQVSQLDPARDDRGSCGRCQRPLPWVVEATDTTLHGLLQRPVLHIVKFSRPDCAPCVMQRGVLVSLLGSLDTTLSSRVRLVEVDASVSPRAATAWQVSSVPVCYLVRGGPAPHVVARFDGLQNQQAFVQAIQSTLASRAPG